MRARGACRRHAASRPRCAAARASSSGSQELVPDAGFSLAKVSFGDILTPLGVGLMTFGFGGYFQLLPGSSVSGVALIYGFPILLLGFALKYAQLDPVTCKTTRAAFELRETQMTDNLKQVREDTTRYRCGARDGFVVPAPTASATARARCCARCASEAQGWRTSMLSSCVRLSRRRWRVAVGTATSSTSTRRSRASS